MNRWTASPGRILKSAKCALEELLQAAHPLLPEFRRELLPDTPDTHH
jgi:hypothetical protein